MQRVTIVENATITNEVLAPNTEIQWNPITNEGNLVFRCEQFTWHGETLVARTPADSVVVPLSEVMPRVFEIPDGQGGTMQVPALMVMAAIKVAFDTFYSEQQAAPEPE
jgi:hypothetical protein